MLDMEKDDDDRRWEYFLLAELRHVLTNGHGQAGRQNGIWEVINDATQVIDAHTMWLITPSQLNEHTRYSFPLRAINVISFLFPQEVFGCSIPYAAQMFTSTIYIHGCSGPDGDSTAHT